MMAEGVEKEAVGVEVEPIADFVVHETNSATSPAVAIDGVADGGSKVVDSPRYLAPPHSLSSPMKSKTELVLPSRVKTSRVDKQANGPNGGLHPSGSSHAHSMGWHMYYQLPSLYGPQSMTHSGGDALGQDIALSPTSSYTCPGSSPFMVHPIPFINTNNKVDDMRSSDMARPDANEGGEGLCSPLGSPVATPTAMMFPQTPFASMGPFSMPGCSPFMPTASSLRSSKNSFVAQHSGLRCGNNSFVAHHSHNSFNDSSNYFHPMFNNFPPFFQLSMQPPPPPPSPRSGGSTSGKAPPPSPGQAPQPSEPSLPRLPSTLSNISIIDRASFDYSWTLSDPNMKTCILGMMYGTGGSRTDAADEHSGMHGDGDGDAGRFETAPLPPPPPPPRISHNENMGEGFSPAEGGYSLSGHWAQGIAYQQGMGGMMYPVQCPNGMMDPEAMINYHMQVAPMSGLPPYMQAGMYPGMLPGGLPPPPPPPPSGGPRHNGGYRGHVQSACSTPARANGASPARQMNQKQGLSTLECKGADNKKADKFSGMLIKYLNQPQPNERQAKWPGVASSTACEASPQPPGSSAASIASSVTATKAPPVSGAAAAVSKARRSLLEPKVGPDGMPRFNSRQRRTLRRAKERAMKGLMEAGYLLLKRNGAAEGGREAKEKSETGGAESKDIHDEDGDDKAAKDSEAEVDSGSCAEKAAMYLDAAFKVAAGSVGPEAAAAASQALSKVASELQSSDISELISVLSEKKDEGLVDEILIKDLQVIQTLVDALKTHAIAAAAKASSNYKPAKTMHLAPPINDVAGCATSPPPPSPPQPGSPTAHTDAATKDLAE